MKSFSKIEFKSDDNLVTACNYIKHCILNDVCLPVNVEACVALLELISDDDDEINPKGKLFSLRILLSSFFSLYFNYKIVKELIGQHIQPIILKMLNLIRDTENDDISNVIQRLIYVYEDEITSYSVEIMKHLSDTFLSIVKFCEENEENDAKDDKTIAAVGILSTVESILHAMEGKLEVMGELEKLTLPIIYAIIQNGMMDFYEELFTLVSDLTSKQISDSMWNVLFLLYDIFQNDAADYFVEMMPVLHNYVMMDTPAFLADPQRIECMFKMIKQVLAANSDDDEAESHAAKLLEIIILQCHGKIDHVLPAFLQLILERLSREILGTELRTMCLQVVVAALWSNTEVVLQTLDQVSIQQNTGRSFLLDFLQKWFTDLDCFFGLHDRKICVLGMCTLLQIAPKRPHDVAQVADKLLPSTCMLLEGLEKVYANRDKDDSEDEFESTDGDLEGMH